MKWDDREKALMAQRELFTSPETRMGAAEHYDELVSMASKLQHQGLSGAEEKNALIWKQRKRPVNSPSELQQ
ncbi:hypothetical protein ACIOVF_19130 [Pseudomonas sp. NPDC087612]|uniref:hypothetical protein n=1 Tax=Pseudomonas sp. NPDC087612 TaxID=3364441 RepID=UPI0038093405